MQPEQALERAREAARRKREAGEYAAPDPGALEATITADKPDLEVIGEWAVIAVDPDLVYSTRRLGAPISAFKRLLIRLLRQYQIELEAQQTRFNIALVAHVRDLEQRLAQLERGE